MQLALPLFAQSPIALQRKLGERINSSEWVFQPPLLRGGVNVELLNRNLWQQFYENNTEMIITKSGRRMFPSVQINVNDLEKRENYYVLMKIAPASYCCRKYCGYQNGGENSNIPVAGVSWGRQSRSSPLAIGFISIPRVRQREAAGWTISFNKLKLTYNINDLNNNVVLTSMHKYVPRIWIVRCFDVKNYNELFTHSTALFAFKETEFIAVTAYQNENIAKLKINNNPFAKGFREMGQSRFKRKHHSIDHQAQSYSSPDEGVSLTYDSESNLPNDPLPLKGSKLIKACDYLLL
ncbi:T-box protein 2 [Temnothorax longispinosus]|uniref:T-box protein 2 n=1 Tax=Temnothorax longispinosus TaxID=300112 RepID=A0A4S2KIH1_9HYME|nr:T-box protein 2 [Temnothorax longispinosus]